MKSVIALVGNRREGQLRWQSDERQAHSTAGRGETLQAFLAANCGVGSQAP